VRRARVDPRVDPHDPSSGASRVFASDRASVLDGDVASRASTPSRPRRSSSSTHPFVERSPVSRRFYSVRRSFDRRRVSL
jgi:hypothetical protein